MRTFRLLIGGTFLATAAPGLAQTADAPVEPDPVSAETAAETQGSDELDTIVVTALRRETNLQRTPISISVASAQDLRNRHVQSLLDLGDGSIPGLRIATYESRQSALTVGIRGIVPGDANQPAREQGVGVYIDGVYLGRQHGLNAALFDIERIEVLRGPQGTLFGRNTEGGAVSIVTRAPTGEFGGHLSAGVGNFGSYNGAIHLNLPELANFLVRVDAVVQHQGATVENPLPGQLGWNSYHRYGGRVAARWEPSDAFTADFAYDIARDENSPFYSQLINFNPQGYPVATLAQIAANGNRLPAGTIAPLPPVVTVTDRRMAVADIGVPQQPSIDRTQGVMARLSWQVAEGIELRSITARRTVDAEQWDNSGGAHRTPSFLPNGNFSRYSLSRLTQRQFTQEFQAVGSVSGVDYVAGLYFFDERAEERAATPNTNRWNATGTDYTINGATTWDPQNWSVARSSHARSRSYAAFGQSTWTPSGLETVHLTAGGRVTHDRKRGDLAIVNNVATTFPFEISTTRFDPLLTIAWDATPDVNLYARYATGYRSGGASSRSLTFRTFGPESVASYELGAKILFLNRRGRFNLAGYVMNRSDSQFDFDFYAPQPNGSIRHTLETVNAPGTTRIRGIEADVTLRATDRLTLGASYAYTHWRVPPTPNPLVAGNPLQPLYIVYTPRHAASGSIDYGIPIGGGGGGTAVRLHLDGNYSGRAHTFDNENVQAEPSFILNARLSVADISMGSGGQLLTLSLWSRNLLDEQHIYRRSNANRFPIDGNFGTVIGDYANFNAPRTFGLEAGLVF
ncbi:MAG: iron complex outerrane recepter protein [Sphingomonadales bacterium]|jgi:iron complex outermembrane receptor protein|nr:iron complex outerrane recepter protein [Sphingomonadales bacterium]